MMRIGLRPKLEQDVGAVMSENLLIEDPIEG